MQKNKKNLLYTIGGTLAVMVYFIWLGTAYSTELTSITDTMESVKISTSTDHTIQFTTTNGVSAAETITIVLPSGFTMTKFDFGDMDLKDDGADLDLAASASGATWGAVTSSQSIIFTSGTGVIASSSVVNIELGRNAAYGVAGANKIANPGSAATYAITIATSFPDNGTSTVRILSDDQVAVSAAVTQSLSFSITDYTIGFGTLGTGAVRYASGDTAGTAGEASAHDVVAGTNAANGYTINIEGPTLASGANTITAIGGAATASNPSNEQFGLKLSASGGSGVVTSPYDTANYAYDGASAADQVASASGASSDTTYSVTYIANIASETESGSYSTALTYVTTGNY